MRQNIGEYNVLYQYILFVITRLPVPSLYAVKAVSFIGDAFLAGAAATLAQKDGKKSAAAFGLALLLPTVALAKTIVVDAADYEISKDGWYDGMEEVAIYLTFFDKLPGNYITKREAQNLGWDNRKGNLWSVAEGCSIGGDRFGNYEGILPDQKGRKWTECDIDFDGGYRNGKRVVFSNDGLIYYTGDHYQTFDEVEVIWTDKDDSFLSGEELKDFVNWLYGE